MSVPVKDGKTEEILSVGIDVGTTTTQMVVSRILVCNTAPGRAAPRMAVTGKEILYRSGIYFTPFLNRDLIDAQGVTEIIAREYHRAGITPDRVDTGAVIITGESAKKDNARSLTEALALFAGNFVVATAGPLLEAVIAGRGSGAAALSQELHRVVLNIDVGGGTSNLAVFREGRAVDATCINIGGRLIELDTGGDRLKYVAPAARAVLEECGLEPDVEQRLTLEQIRSVARTMAGAVRALLNKGPLPHLARRLMMGPPLRIDYPVEAVAFSGGVADFVYSEEKIRSVREGSRYGDIGPFLGVALKEAFAGERWRLIRPKETIGATVIGAGVHTLNLSGSTVKVTAGLLPMRNVPVVKPFPGNIPPLAADLAEGLNIQLAPYRSEGFKEPLAIALKGLGGMDFARIREVAGAIASVTRDYVNSGQPLVLVLEEDYGKVLGQTLGAVLGVKAGIICLDQLSVDDGDYVDINEPVVDGIVVPVIVKTMVFEGDR